ncbi:MAG: M50 family metallopeptidase, partial [Promethearchaeota archaeon]
GGFEKMKVRLGKIFGINITFHISALITAILAAFSVGTELVKNFPLISRTLLFLLSISAGVVFLFSILIHELMHSVVSIHEGIPVKEIELYIFGGVAKITSEPESPKTEFKIAIAGPITSILLGIIFMVIGSLNNLFDILLPIAFFFNYMGYLNVMLGLFNLIPAFPMDGGRVLRALIWKKKADLTSATRISATVGRFIANFFIFIGLFEIIAGAFLNGLWMIIIGNFLYSAANQSYLATLYMQNLEQIKVSEIMHNIYPVLHPDLDIITAYNNYVSLYPPRHYLVANDLEFVGVISAKKIINALSKIYHVQKSSIYGAPQNLILHNIFNGNNNQIIRIRDLMTPIKYSKYISPDASAKKAYQLLMSDNKTDYIIVSEFDTDDIVGVIDLHSFSRLV